ncbi:ferredoxin [Thermosipho melanesiensis]|uniref:4Fe-4S ferredoxin, iron-sulfur binding domain protein n=2 Tax=Thermosipho melanesiensis TaxID=46541 RepID=A6LKB0_THEM4|nr:[Fe-Fe] hydrogenase large subunit C-terminal domain-containing protein [Thermosipho melanesiensis]ABR30361.1 4Fe-4S ferredoxin, iron-sulfur binding domain protein [Thermosipho melanesiensis BI429]APT73527.1 ferredoxin [Thermosipho melanesiensis]OOC37477.1 ferredoxin [Thermosipho melanesiensis]OOC39682.1 ferredoxin [Thermosipho melanesiensis]OOC39710.1 ferredoxin [Thermosipho melanesiensis]
MEKYIISNDANCKYCYKCLRNCPVKSISFSENKSIVIDEQCIVCGTCIEICPQNAKNYKKDLDKLLLLFGNRFVVSIAPSFFAHFDNPFKVIAFLKKNGAIVNETSLGAEYVSREYEKFDKTVISTACPVVVELIEKYFPEKIDFLANVVSPAVAHAKILKKLYDFPLVFLGPCIAKKRELEGYFDVVITFEELEEVFDENFDEAFPDAPYPNMGRYYPITGGIIKNTNFQNHITIEGVENIKKFLSRLDVIDEKYFIEMSACVGGCIEGPCSRKDISLIEKKTRLLKSIKKLPKGDLTEFDIDLKRKFLSQKKEVQYSKEEIQKVLISMGKSDKSKELNCSACGYDTCQEKAIAVLEKKAEKEMCITYLIEKVSSVSNMLVEETPNLIIITHNGKIVYKNKVARLKFMSLSNVKIMELVKNINNNQIEEMEINGRRYKFLTKRFLLPENSGEVFILTDITKEIEQEEKMKMLKKQTIEKIEEVLNKQMLLAQEIASLLGESIAETKSHFVEFKKFMEE